MLRLIFTAQLFMLSIVIFWLSSIPNILLPNLGFDFFDKIIHAIVFFIYGVSAQLAVMSLLQNRRAFVKISIALSISIAFAASDELHQLSVPGRMGAIDDFLADLVGIAISLSTMSVLEKFVVPRR